MPKVNVAAFSDTGRVRKNNEDNLFCNGVYKENNHVQDFLYQECEEIERENTYAVFDGIGGMASGEEASLLAAQVLGEYKSMHGKESYDLCELIYLMNHAICCRINEQGKNMGSTAVLLLLGMNEVQVANIGDSRAYLFRDGVLTQLSKDHTKADSLLEMQNELGLDIKIDVSGMYGILSQHLGVSEDEFIIEPEVTEKIISKKKDIYILCSDGLSNYVSDQKIAEILSRKKNVMEKVSSLKEEALSAGGKDNITIILLEKMD